MQRTAGLDACNLAHARPRATAGAAVRSGTAGRDGRLRASRTHQEPDDHGRLRLPRPGIAVRRDGPSPRRRQPGRRGGLRRRPTRRSASRSRRSPGRARPSVLDRTENAQPALLATSIAYPRRAPRALAGLGIAAPQPAFYAGHSMGQYSAMVAAGVLELGDGVRLVRERGRLMQASGAGREGRMAAIIGLDDARLPELVDRAGAHGVFGVANRNSPGPGRRVRRAAGGRGGARAGPRARRQAGDRAAGLGRGPLAADGRGGRRDADRARRRSLRRPDGTAPRQPRRAAR